MTNVGDRATGRTRLLSRMCNTCIFRPPGDGRIALSNARVTEFIRDAVARDTYIVCHSTLPATAPPGVKPAVCRGFADRYTTRDLRLIRALWDFTEVDPPTPERT
jgi:hypothetical protein